MRYIRPAVLSAALAAAVLLTALPATSAPVLEKTVNTVRTQTFRNPVNPGADPSLFYYGGQYPRGDHDRRPHRHLVVAEPGDPAAAPEKVVWRDTDPSRNTQMWAPAFRHVGSRWYIYYTASDGVDANHRMYVLESAGDDPTGPYSFKAKLADFGEYAIDGEPITHNGQQYFVWTGPGRGQGGPAQLYIVRMSDPWTRRAPGRDPRGRWLYRATGGSDAVVPQRADLPTRTRPATPASRTTSCGLKSIANGADPMVAANWVQHPDRSSRATTRPASGTRAPLLLPVAGRYRVLDRLPRQEHQRLHLLLPHRASAEDQLERGRHAEPRQPPRRRRHPEPPVGDPGAATSVINDTDVGTGQNQVQYARSWSSGSGCGNQCFWGNDHWSNQLNASATIRFTGTKVALLSVMDTGNGIAGISIDGGAEQRVDYYSSIRVGEQLVYLSPTLPAGPHTLKVRVTGSKNASSSNTVISLDRIEVY